MLLCQNIQGPDASSAVHEGKESLTYTLYAIPNMENMTMRVYLSVLSLTVRGDPHALHYPFRLFRH